MGTVKELGSRLDKLQSDFHKQMNEFKTQYTENVKINLNAVGKEDFLKKFSEFENAIMENITVIKNDISALTVSQEAFKKKLDGYEYTGNRNSVVIYGVLEEENNNAELLNKILDICNGKLKTKVAKSDISFIYRTGKKGEKIRPVIVSFINRWKRDNIYLTKKLLKGSGLFMSEWLPTNVLILLKKARNLFGKDSWVKNGKVLVKINGIIKVIKGESDLREDN